MTEEEKDEVIRGVLATAERVYSRIDTEDESTSIIGYYLDLLFRELGYDPAEPMWDGSDD